MNWERLTLSILSADFTRLGEQLREAEKAGGNCFHMDIMDGHFVPNISFGPEVVRQVNALTDKFLDVHLMLSNPDSYLTQFVEAGADLISVHVEACPHLHQTVGAIKKLGCQAGVALNPSTSLNRLEEILPLVDQVILMSVNPGFGGQKFIPEILFKLKCLEKMRRARGWKGIIEIDGGINLDNAQELLENHAGRLVLGSSVFNSKGSIAENLSKFIALANCNLRDDSPK